MKRSDLKAGIESSLGTLLTNMNDGNVRTQTDFGTFACSVETYENLAIAKRSFETAGESLRIPFSSEEPCVYMMFSFNGRSVMNNRTQPLILEPSSQCINFFKRYDCANLLNEKSRQHDITFRLRKSFYTELITRHLSFAEDRIPAMIARGKEFHTINQHIPMDEGVTGIVKNILDCPFEGEMKKLFVREHLRALFTLQLLHFNTVVTGEPLRIDRKITSRDRGILEEVKEYIDRNFLDPNSLESLSRNFGLNEFKLKHGFKALFDTSPIRYLQQKRLTFARTLLLETDKTVKEIAHEIGYSHAANFTTAFIKTFGYSPQRYRQSMEAEPA